MDNSERRRKLKQAYELLCLATEMIVDVSAGCEQRIAEDLCELAHEIECTAADLSAHALEDHPDQSKPS